jgi:hypothetical protein
MAAPFVNQADRLTQQNRGLHQVHIYILQKCRWSRKLDSVGSEDSPVAGSCGHGDEPPVCIKRDELLCQLREVSISQGGPCTWSELVIAGEECSLMATYVVREIPTRDLPPLDAISVLQSLEPQWLLLVAINVTEIQGVLFKMQP